jgi:NADH-quinone oxidoreductase subunit N
MRWLVVAALGLAIGAATCGDERDGDQAWLAAVAVVNTVVSLYYYLRVIAPAVIEQPARRAAAPAHRSLTAALALTAVATVAFGVAAEPLLRLAERATMLG